MIPLKKIKGEDFWINPDLIESISQSPDTVITLSSGKSIIVMETPEEIRDRVVAFRRRIFGGLLIKTDKDS